MSTFRGELTAQTGGFTQSVPKTYVFATFSTASSVWPGLWTEQDLAVRGDRIGCIETDDI